MAANKFFPVRNIPESEASHIEANPHDIYPNYNDLSHNEQDTDGARDPNGTYLRWHAYETEHINRQQLLQTKLDECLERTKNLMTPKQVRNGNREVTMAQDPIWRMSKQFVNMRGSDYRVFQFMAYNPSFIAQKNPKQICAMVKLNSSQINDYATRFSYKDFTDLQQAFKAHFSNKSKPGRKHRANLDAPSPLSVNMLDCKVNKNEPLEACDRISRAKRICCAGQGLSEGAAQQMACILQNKGFDAVSMGIDSMFNSLYSINESDLLIIYHNPLLEYKEERLKRVLPANGRTREVILVATSIPTNLIIRSDNLLFTFAYDSDDYVLNAPVGFASINVMLNDQIDSRRIPVSR